MSVLRLVSAPALTLFFMDHIAQIVEIIEIKQVKVRSLTLLVRKLGGGHIKNGLKKGLLVFLVESLSQLFFGCSDIPI